MERKKAGLLGALAGVAALGGTAAQAASHDAVMPPEPVAVTSYSDLLRPIPNAVEALKVHNAELMERANNAPAGVEQVQWYGEGDGYRLITTITITITITTTTTTTITIITTSITPHPRRLSWRRRTLPLCRRPSSSRRNGKLALVVCCPVPGPGSAKNAAVGAVKNSFGRRDPPRVLA